MCCSYSDVSHDSFSACYKKGDVKGTFVICGFAVNMLSQILFGELHYAVGVTELCNLTHKYTHNVTVTAQ